MDRGWWSKFALVLLCTLGSIWFLVPSYYSFFVLPKEQRNNLKVLEERLPGWAPPARYRLNLGLDLQGGIHMVMRVDTQTALQKRTERRGVQIANYLKEKKLGEVDAIANPEKLELNRERFDHWLKNGAVASDTVRTLVDRMPPAVVTAEGATPDLSAEARSAKVETPAS